MFREESENAVQWKACWIAVVILLAVISFSCKPRQIRDLSKADSPIELSIAKERWDQSETIFLSLRVNSIPDAALLFPYVDQSIIGLEIADSDGGTASSSSKTAVSGFQRFLSKNSDAIFSEQISSIDFRIPINQEHPLFRCYELGPGHYRVRLTYDATLCPWTRPCRSSAFYEENRNRILIGPFLSNWVEFSVSPAKTPSK